MLNLYINLGNPFFFFNLDLNLSISPMGFPGSSVVKTLPASSGDMGSTPELRRLAGVGNSNPLQCSCLGNPMERGIWRAIVGGVAKDLNMS